MTMLALGFALAAMPGGAPGQVNPERVLIKVNGEAIKGNAYYRRMEFLPGMGKMAGNTFVQGSPGFFTLQTLINETLMLQLAAEKKLTPTDAEVKAEMDRRLKDNPKVLEAFKLLGFTEADFRYDTLVQVAEFKLTTAGINITDQEVEAFYKGNRKRYSLPKRYLLRVIAVTSQAKQTEVDQALSSGSSFKDVASRLSEEPSKLNGGLIGEVSEDELGAVAKPAITTSKKGDVTPWLVGTEARLKFLVEDILPPQTFALDAELKKEIRRNLMIDRGRARNNLPKMMDEMRKKAKFEYTNTAFDDQIRRSFSGS